MSEWIPIEDGAEVELTAMAAMGVPRISKARVMPNGGLPILITKTDMGGTSGVWHSVRLPSDIRLCRRSPAPALDAPDGPGWWAIRITIQDGDEIVLVLQVRQDADGTLRYDDESRARKIHKGKFYKLTMPWEHPAPAVPVPADVREAIGEALTAQRAIAEKDIRLYTSLGSQITKGEIGILEKAKARLARIDAALAWWQAQEGAK